MKFFNIVFFIISLFSALTLFNATPLRNNKEIEGVLLFITIIGMFYFGLLFALSFSGGKSNNYRDPGVGDSDGGGY